MASPAIGPATSGAAEDSVVAPALMAGTAAAGAVCTSRTDAFVSGSGKRAARSVSTSSLPNPEAAESSSWWFSGVSRRASSRAVVGLRVREQHVDDHGKPPGRARRPDAVVDGVLRQTQDGSAVLEQRREPRGLIEPPRIELRQMHDERDGGLGLVLREPPQCGSEFLVAEVGSVRDLHGRLIARMPVRAGPVPC